MGLPGFGMRISVSKQDLTEIQQAGADVAAERLAEAKKAARTEAYPAGKEHIQ